MNTDTDNLFRLNTLLLRLRVQKVKHQKYYSHKNRLAREAAKGPILGH